MAQDSWNAVDKYFENVLIPRDAALEAAIKANADAGLPAIDVAPNQGKMLYLLAKIRGARKILEIGTLGGYSTIWMARALPKDGKIVTCEAVAKHAKVAESNIKNAGLDNVVDIRLGKAKDTLAKLDAEKAGPFDMVFLDADKENNPTYLEWTLKLGKPGTLIVFDNVVRHGGIADIRNRDEGNTRGLQKMFEMIKKDKRLDATAIQTVGLKGWDGFSLAVIVDPDE